MSGKLYYNTVTKELRKALNILMSGKEFLPFRLVGGTSLSLQIGHRKSIDIDLFTDAKYDSLDFAVLDKFLRKNFKYVDGILSEKVGMGLSYFVGENEKDCIKLDIFYTDTFIFPSLEIDNIRMATIEEIIAMKADTISRGGRKKDFWDLHELINKYSFKQMLAFHKKRHLYTHEPKHIKKEFTNFENADTEADPDCLRGKVWELIKLDLADFVNAN